MHDGSFLHAGYTRKNSCDTIYKMRKKGTGVMEKTDIFRNNIDFLTQEERSAEQMAEFLKEGAVFCQFDQVLRQVCQGEDLASRLETGLAEISGESPAAGGRKVRNWLNGSNAPKNRETLFQICFVLGLGETDASKVLGNASGTGIHYRNPEELVYAYGLRAGIRYPEAVELKEIFGCMYRRQKGRRIIHCFRECSKNTGPARAVF